MNNIKPSTQEIMKEMSSLTAISGRISELQAYNLQLFPFVFFNHVNKVKIDYDLAPIKSIADEPTTSNLTVSYFLSLDSDAMNDNVDKRFLALEKAVRSLFWSDVKIEIFFNDKIVYKSLK